MGFDSPQDMAWMFIIFAAVIVTFGYGLVSVQEFQGVTQNASFFNSIENKVNSEEGLKGAAEAQEAALAGETGASGTPTEESIFVRSWNAMKDLGKAWSAFEDGMEEGMDIVGLNPIYWTLLSSGILITFAVVLYTWVRAR